MFSNADNAASRLAYTRSNRMMYNITMLDNRIVYVNDMSLYFNVGKILQL